MTHRANSHSCEWRESGSAMATAQIMSVGCFVFFLLLGGGCEY